MWIPAHIQLEPWLGLRFVYPLIAVSEANRVLQAQSEALACCLQKQSFCEAPCHQSRLSKQGILPRTQRHRRGTYPEGLWLCWSCFAPGMCVGGDPQEGRWIGASHPTDTRAALKNSLVPKGADRISRSLCGLCIAPTGRYDMKCQIVVWTRYLRQLSVVKRPSQAWLMAQRATIAVWEVLASAPINRCCIPEGRHPLQWRLRDKVLG